MDKPNFYSKEFLMAFLYATAFVLMVWLALFLAIPKRPPTELFCNGKSLGVAEKGWIYWNKSASWEGRGFYRMKDGETCFVVEVKGEKS